VLFLLLFGLIRISFGLIREKMKKSEKVFEVENLTAKIKGAKSVSLADYRGITMAQISTLRDKVKDAGGEVQVVKNTLFTRALKDAGIKELDTPLTGPTLALFANDDEIAPLKALAAFGKQANLLALKLGFMADKILSSEELTRLALLPTKPELQAKLVGLLASQPQRLVFSLNWNLQKLVLVLNGVKNKKQ